MRRDDRLDVPLAKSSRSTSAVLSPRIAASRATPAPVMPPPMTSTSNRAWLSSSSAARRACAEKGRVVTVRYPAGRGDDGATLLCSTHGNHEQRTARRDRRGTAYSVHQIRDGV